MSTWNYISEGAQARRIGPTTEDFHAVFKRGTSNTSIGVQDLASVALAAAKALEERTAELQEKTAEVDELRARVMSLEERLRETGRCG